MFTTVDVHVDAETTVVEINATGTGLLLTPEANAINDSRVNLFLGGSQREIRTNAQLLIDALLQLRDDV